MIGIHSELLSSAGLGGEWRESLEFLLQANGQLQRLISGLAEFAAAAGPPPALSPVRLDLPLRQALQELDERMKTLNCNVSCDSPLPVVLGDFDRLRTLFRHQLLNAIQYHGEGAIEVTISARLVEELWLVRIRDNGPGIDAKFHERIFEPYYRLHGKSHPGNGLGLSISRLIVESLGGKIWVESQPGGGSEFCFTLQVCS